MKSVALETWTTDNGEIKMDFHSVVNAVHAALLMNKK